MRSPVTLVVALSVALITGILVIAGCQKKQESAASGRRVITTMNGTKVATFALGQKLAPGKYHVRGYWGGNVAGDRDFVVVAKSKRSK